MRTRDDKDTKSLIDIAPKNHFASEMDHMADCVLTGATPRTPDEEGLRDMRIMEAIHRAAEGHTSVRI